MKNTLPRWFTNRLRTIMEHNKYSDEMITVPECDKHNKWTPVDLVLREYYNNGGGSSQGFLGISRHECFRCYDFIKENQKQLKELDYYNKNGFNNCGFPLWENWDIH